MSDIVNCSNATAGNKKQFLLFTAAVITGILVYFLLASTDLSQQGRQTVGILVAASILWATNTVHPAFTSVMILLSLVLCGVLSFDAAAAYLGKPVIWMIMSVLLIGQAVERTGLANRIALNLLKLANGNLKMVVLMSMFTVYALVLIVPTIIGRVTLVVPILGGMIEASKNEGAGNFGKASFIGITYASILGALSFMTGASSLIYASGYINEALGAGLTFLKWMTVFMPFSILSVISAWTILILLFPPGESAPRSQAYVAEKVKELGGLRGGEVKIMVILLLMLLAWFAEGAIQLQKEFTALLAASAIFLPGISLLEWKQAIREVDWSVLILFSISLAMANALEQTGTAQWIAGVLSGVIAGQPAPFVAVAVAISCILLRLGLNNMNSLLAGFLPVIISLAAAHEISPLWLVLLTVAASCLGLILPSQSPSFVVTFSYGYYSSSDLIKTGLLSYLALIIILVLISTLYWPAIGIAP